LALRALCEKPSLWRTSQSGAGVIVFRANDYADPSSSAVVAEVAAIPALARDAKNFAAICGAEFGVVPTLAHFATGSNIPRAVAQLKPRSTTVTRAAAPVGYISAYPVLNATDYTAFEKGIGQMVELIGKVVEVKVDRTRGGKPYIFVNFGHWRGNTVKINVWNEALSKGGEHPSEVWVGRWVTMRGLVEPVYANKKFNYQHISITANAVTQISQLTEAEAKYRLSAPRTPITRAATSSVTSNNSAVLELLRGSSPTATPPMASGGQHHPTHSSASRNQSILQSMKGATSSTRPAPPQQSAANSSTRGAAPSPSPFKQHTPTKQTPSGLLGWLAGLFK
jgi:hypothetical protein